MSEVVCRSAEETLSAIKAGDVPVLEGDFRVEILTAVDCRIIVRKGQPHVVVLYKALSGEFGGPHNGFRYVPGTTPEAPDWDGAVRECGGGLHFSPTVTHALEFMHYAQKFVACPVKLSEIVVHPDGTYPQKVKAPRVCAPCWEVDRRGKRVETKS